MSSPYDSRCGSSATAEVGSGGALQGCCLAAILTMTCLGVFCDEQATQPGVTPAVAVNSPPCDTTVYGGSTLQIRLHADSALTTASIGLHIGARRCIQNGLPEQVDLLEGDTVFYAFVPKDSVLTVGASDNSDTTKVCVVTDSARIIVNNVSSCGGIAGAHEGIFRIRPAVWFVRPREGDVIAGGEQCTVVAFGNRLVVFHLYFGNGRHRWSVSDTKVELTQDSMLVFTMPSEIVRTVTGDTIPTVSDSCWIVATPYNSTEEYARSGVFGISSSQ